MGSFCSVRSIWCPTEGSQIIDIAIVSIILARIMTMTAARVATMQMLELQVASFPWGGCDETYRSTYSAGYFN